MLNKKIFLVALALALGVSSNAVAAKKKHSGIHHRPLMSTAVKSAFARAGSPTWVYDRAKGNINGF